MPEDPIALDKLTPLAEDPTELLAALADGRRTAGKWHDLFECRLMQARLAAGLPVDFLSISLAPEAQQGELERAYRGACVEVAEGLLAESRRREAWHYLKAAGETDAMRASLLAAQIDDDNYEELIELALHEGAYPELGYKWLLERHGTCNSVTTLDGMGPYLSPEDQHACAGVLVEWMTDELAESIRGHIERQEGAPPESTDLVELMTGRDWLFEHEASHVDASHLSATVRWSRVLKDQSLIRKAVQLAEYGSRLHESLQYPEPAPFEQTYRANLLFLRATLCEGAEEAAEYFRQQAANTDDPMNRPACLDAYLTLMLRCGKAGEALAQYANLIDDQVQLPPTTPSPLDLARASGDWAAYDQLMQSKADAIGYAAGLIARRENAI